MYAIAEISGTQIKISSGDIVRVPHQKLDVGTSITIDKFLFAVKDDGTVALGKPYLNGSATATVVEHDRDPKIHLLHKKRRKGYIKQGGHRQQFSMIKIESMAL